MGKLPAGLAKWQAAHPRGAAKAKAPATTTVKAHVRAAPKAGAPPIVVKAHKRGVVPPAFNAHQFKKGHK